MKALNELKKLLKAYRSYSLDHLKKCLEFDQKHILVALNSNDVFYPHHIIGMSISFAQMAFREIESHNLDSHAIDHLNRSLMYMGVAVELQLNDFKRNPIDKMNVHRFKKYFSAFSALLFWAILLDNKNLAKKMARQVEFCLKQKAISDFPLSYDYFSLWSYYHWINEALPFELPMKGSFQYLTENWSKDSISLSPSLIEISELHCEELIDNDKREYPPKFISPPFTLLPLEIHVINKLRLLDGLDKMDVDHPLMKTQSAQITNFEIVEDELLERIQINLL